MRRTDPDEIFRSYDIRGRCPQEIGAGVAYLVGRALVKYTKAKTICIGCDARISSPSLYKAAISGVIDQGANVVEIGLCSTPQFYYTTAKYSAGLMITASHLGPAFNGIKMCRRNAIPIGKGSGMEHIKRLVLAQNFSTPKKKGTIRAKNMLHEFVSFSRRVLKTKKRFRIVVDAGNGMGGLTYAQLKKQIPNNIELIPLFWRIDCTFPHHEANPIKRRTLKQLKETVVKEKADFGVALDGDADRCIFVDEKGRIIPASLSSALLIHELLLKKPDNPTKKPIIVYDVRSSWVLREEAAAQGAKAVEWRVGHAHIKKKMRAVNAIFGSEVVGHLYHREMHYCENEIIPVMRMLNILAHYDKPLSELLKPFERYAKSPEINFPLAHHDDADGLLTKIESKYKKHAKRISKIDGLKMEFADWWFSLRASNTEPALRLNIEAKNKVLLKEYKQKLTSIIEK